jgi:uncharacterized repeat protein (TIGR03806 family)
MRTTHHHTLRRRLCLLGLLAGLIAGCQLGGRAPEPAASAEAAGQSGSARPALIALPACATGPLPRLLSQTGAFTDLAALTPAQALMPYQVIAPLWSDGAQKGRWLAVPRGRTIAFAAEGEWGFPAGTVFVKHFAITTDERVPERQRRLETRFLVRDEAGGVYGVTYRWRADGSDAELLAGGLDEPVAVVTASGATRMQTWHYPSREECLRCHNPVAGFVLGVSTRQLDHPSPGRPGQAASPSPDNPLQRLADRGWLDHPPPASSLATLPHLVAPDNDSESLESRVRSYIDANCAFCHRPGMVGFANFDGRAAIPLDQANLIRGRVIIDHGIDRARNIMPKDPWRSMILVRLEAEDELRMPPLAHQRIDRSAATLLRAWIASLPGKPALPPPMLDPSAGRFAHPVTVLVAEPDPQAIVHYTTDGSLPDEDSPVAHGSLLIDAPTTLRAKAFRPGFASSVVVNAVLLVHPQGP